MTDLNPIANARDKRLLPPYQLSLKDVPFYVTEMSKRLVIPFMENRLSFRDLVHGFTDCAFQLKHLLAQNQVRAGLARAIEKGHKLGRKHKHGKDAQKIVKTIVKRSREGWSLSQIAKLVGFSRSRISQILSALRDRP